MSIPSGSGLLVTLWLLSRAYREYKSPRYRSRGSLMTNMVDEARDKETRLMSLSCKWIVQFTCTVTFCLHEADVADESVLKVRHRTS